MIVLFVYEISFHISLLVFFLENENCLYEADRKNYIPTFSNQSIVRVVPIYKNLKEENENEKRLIVLLFLKK